ncbi:sigma-70 family RNA polymerase sigma factor [Marinicella rhabdoformis]|uniref:sigma-70 family RNA polymerase sigma factor n=1 Tax=Marinicella rhabdoformis TaxID=2580566 RepID=UPI0012AECEFA|nr:sigma-70 family RNA polymerase sigma factor [Marinicella rhabdoformis]
MNDKHIANNIDSSADEQLMLLFANNEKDIGMDKAQRAFDRLYQRHKGPLYRFVKKTCNNEQDANEVFQELWLRIINNKSQFNPEYKFTTWAYTIANRLLIDWLRKNGKLKNSVSPDETIDELAVALGENQLELPENELERKRMAKQLTEAITTLPDQQRMTFVMKHESGLSLSEVANATDQPLERIKSQYRYAIKKLKHTLEHWR